MALVYGPTAISRPSELPGLAPGVRGPRGTSCSRVRTRQVGGQRELGSIREDRRGTYACFDSIPGGSVGERNERAFSDCIPESTSGGGNDGGGSGGQGWGNSGRGDNEENDEEMEWLVGRRLLRFLIEHSLLIFNMVLILSRLGRTGSTKRGRYRGGYEHAQRARQEYEEQMHRRKPTSRRRARRQSHRSWQYGEHPVYSDEEESGHWGAWKDSQGPAEFQEDWRSYEFPRPPPVGTYPGGGAYEDAYRSYFQGFRPFSVEEPDWDQYVKQGYWQPPDNGDHWQSSSSPFQRDFDAAAREEYVRRERAQWQQKARKRSQQRGYGTPDFQQYESRWNVLLDPGSATILGMNEIPWPPPGNPLFLERGDSRATVKLKLKQALLRWHPDKFAARCGHRLDESDRRRIELRATTVAHDVLLAKDSIDSISD